jgi:hypothetical protein
LSVRILTTRAIDVDHAAIATIEGRRKRLNALLVPALAQAGWQATTQPGGFVKAQ